MKRLLLVEDDERFADLLAAALVAAGECEVCVADTFAEALDCFQEFHFHLVVSDFDLGGGPTGLDVIAASPKRTRKVLMSAVDRADEIGHLALTPGEQRPDRFLLKDSSIVDEILAELAKAKS